MCLKKKSSKSSRMVNKSLLICLFTHLFFNLFLISTKNFSFNLLFHSIVFFFSFYSVLLIPAFSFYSIIQNHIFKALEFRFLCGKNRKSKKRKIIWVVLFFVDSQFLISFFKKQIWSALCIRLFNNFFFSDFFYFGKNGKFFFFKNILV